MTDIVVNVKRTWTSDPKISPYGPFDSLFDDMTSAWWRKAAAVRVPSASLPGGAQAAEKLAIYYGPLFDPSFNATTTPMPVTADSADATDFVAQLQQGIFIRDQLAGLHKDGKVPLLPSIVLDVNLERSALTFDNQYAVIQYDTRSTNSPPTFRPGLNGTSLIVHPNRQSVYGEYVAGTNVETTPLTDAGGTFDGRSFISDLVDADTSADFFDILTTAPSDLIDADTKKVKPEAAARTPQFIARLLTIQSVPIGREVRERLLTGLYGTPVLFSKVSTRNATVIPTRNQPGTFVFRNGNESFLIDASSTAGVTFPRTDASLTVTTPIQAVTEQSFITRDINSDLSALFYSLLSDYLTLRKRVIRSRRHHDHVRSQGARWR